MWRWVILAVFVLLAGRNLAIATPAALTPEKIEEIDQFVEQRMEDLNIPGVAIALIDGGEVVHAKGFGITKRLGDPISADTPFLIGSITKSFTALAVMQLVEEGLVELDDPVVEHVRWFQTNEPIVSDTITIRHLLAHRSGISMLVGNRNQDGGRSDGKAFAEAVQKLSAVKLVSAPGERYEYSNANYMILGLLLENVTGQPYEEVIEARILTPIGMDNSFVWPPEADTVPPATGHRFWIGRPAGFDGKIGRSILAQGGVRASANDMAAYLLTYMQAGAGSVSGESLTQMVTPYDPEAESLYGFGWMVDEFEGYRLVYHTGSNPGFEGVAGFSPEAEFGFVVLTNTNSSFGSRDISALTLGVGNLVMDLPPPPVSAVLWQKVLLVLIYLAPFLLAFEVFWFIRSYRNGNLAQGDRGFRNVSFLLRVIAPSIALIALAAAWLWLVPVINGAPMPAIALFNPDIALALRTGGYTALIWGILRLVLRMRTWRFFPR